MNYSLLDYAQQLGASFADLRRIRTKELSLLVTEDREIVSTNGVDDGYSLRVLYKGNWGYYSSSEEITKENVKDAIESAIGDETVNIVYLQPKHDKVEIKPKLQVNKSIEEKMNDLKKLREQILRLDNKVKSVSIRYYEGEVHREYLSTDDRDITVDYTLSGLSIVVTGREGDNIVSSTYSKYTYIGYPLEVLGEEHILETIKRRIQNQFIGESVKADNYEVILAPEVVGVFAHEAVGHLAEADLAINGILHPLRGKLIAPDFVNIVDSPLQYYNSAIGVVPYDDEGVEGRDVYIVKNGVVNEYLTDRFYSAYLGQKPTGNARAEDFRNPVIVRMRNTFIAPGEHSYEEMVRETKYGILLVSPRGGQTSPDGTFQFGIQEGYIIQNGEVTKPIKMAGISGYTLETLRDITAVSKQLDFSSGFCGKEGQSVPVGTGGAYVKVKSMKVGGLVG
jgi:Predicted Zn-dependent proteases and their inactivated homologs